MPSLPAHINSLNFSTQLDTVKQLLDAGEAKTTDWGDRIVEVQGFTDFVYLSDIAKKIVEASERNTDNLTTAERIAGIDVVNKLKKFYRVTDGQIENFSFFIRILDWFREFSFFAYGPRFYIETSAERNFRAYSKTNFLQTFGGNFGPWTGCHPAQDITYEPSSRIVAKEEEIRLLQANHFVRFVVLPCRNAFNSFMNALPDAPSSSTEWNDHTETVSAVFDFASWMSKPTPKAEPASTGTPSVGFARTKRR